MGRERHGSRPVLVHALDRAMRDLVQPRLKGDAPTEGALSGRMSPSLRKLALAAVVTLLMACHWLTDPGDDSTWVTLTASEAYTCGLSPGGQAFCWGGVGGWYDQPDPDSIIPNSALPLRVAGVPRFTQITAGGLSMCALDVEGSAFCWGANVRGEVGDGSYLAKRGPSAVKGDFQWRMLSAGATAYACGIVTDGRAYCWGNEFRGALGNGEVNGAISHPVPVSGGLSFESIYTGAGTTCGLTLNRESYCWGVDDYGLLGDSEPPELFNEKANPSRVVGGLTFSSLTVGSYNVCGITEDARAYCWGYGGALGNGSPEPSSTPVPVSGSLRWSSLTSGSGHTCGLTLEGALFCWGSNQFGQLGIGKGGTALTPQRVAGPGVYVQVVAGGYHTCARTPRGTAFCWGQGKYGQLGDGRFADRTSPVQVARQP